MAPNHHFTYQSFSAHEQVQEVPSLLDIRSMTLQKSGLRKE